MNILILGVCIVIGILVGIGISKLFPSIQMTDWTNKEFDGTAYLFAAFFCHLLTLICIFAVAIYLHDKKIETAILTPELVHVMLIGSFGILNLMGGFLFGKAAGKEELRKELDHGNGTPKP